jgi:prolipoprotein diacylglyceryl transferase
VNGVLLGIEPVIFPLGPFVVRWSGVLLIAAVALGAWLTVRRAAMGGLTYGTLLDFAVWVVPSAFIGARLLYVLEEWEYFLTRPAEILELSTIGLNAWGALFGAGLIAWALCRRRGVRLLLLGDSAAPGLALAEAIGRIGSFMNGDGQGLPSSLPWATHYSSANALTPDYGVPRHPAQLYQAAADLAIFGLLISLRRAALPLGTQFFLWLGLYGASRVLVGLVRLDPPFLLALSQGQLLGLAAVALSGPAIIFLTFRGLVSPSSR